MKTVGLYRYKAKMANKTATPPTTPPTIAPSGRLLLPKGLQPAGTHYYSSLQSFWLQINTFVESTFSWFSSQSMEQYWNDQPPTIQKSVASKMVNIYQSVHKGNLGSRRFFDWVHKVYNLHNTIWWNISVIRRDTSKSSAWDMFDYTPRNQG